MRAPRRPAVSLITVEETVGGARSNGMTADTSPARHESPSSAAAVGGPRRLLGELRGHGLPGTHRP